MLAETVLSSQVSMATTTTSISPPPNLETRIYHAREVLSGESLAARLTEFINESFRTSTNYKPTHWVPDVRFHSPTEIHGLLGADGRIAVVMDNDEIVACGSLAVWHGDLDGNGTDEVGWEVKAVATKSGQEKMGLARKCVDVLIEEVGKKEFDDGEGTIKLWCQAVDEVNGDYWRRRGWVDVRSYPRPAGIWGSKFGFRLAVLVKDVKIPLNKN